MHQVDKFTHNVICQIKENDLDYVILQSKSSSIIILPDSLLFN